MKKLLLTPLFCLIGLSLFGQTFMTSFKHTFKGLSIESSGVSHIKDIACPQIQLSQFGGSGKIDSNYLDVAEELFRIYQFSKTTGQPDITQWDTFHLILKLMRVWHVLWNTLTTTTVFIN